RCRLPPPARSAVTAAVTSAARRLPVKRRAALPAAPASAARPRTVVEDLDLAGVDELPELRMFGGLRGDLSSLSRAEVQGLVTGQRDAQRFPGLVGDGLHRCLVIRQVAERYFLPFPGIDGGWRSLSCVGLDWAAPSTLAASSCFWRRCFDFVDVSPMVSSPRWRRPSARRSQSRRQSARRPRARLPQTHQNGRWAVGAESIHGNA